MRVNKARQVKISQVLKIKKRSNHLFRGAGGKVRSSQDEVDVVDNFAVEQDSSIRLVALHTNKPGNGPLQTPPQTRHPSHDGLVQSGPLLPNK